MIIGRRNAALVRTSRPVVRFRRDGVRGAAAEAGMLPSKEDLPRILIPPVVAVALTLLFFAVFDRWDKLDNPINSLVVPVLGVVGFLVGALLDRRGVVRTKPADGSGSDAGGPA